MSFIATIAENHEDKPKNRFASVSNTFEEACKTLIEKCIELDLISYDIYWDMCSDNHKKIISREEFVKMVCDLPLLKVLKYQDCYYDENWSVSIFKLVQGEYVECNLKTGEQLAKGEEQCHPDDESSDDEMDEESGEESENEVSDSD